MRMSNGVPYPPFVSLYSGVDARDAAFPTPDTEAHNPNLVPVTCFLAHQRPSAVTLNNIWRSVNIASKGHICVRIQRI